MKIAFVGDIHGRIFHTLAVLTEWQQQNKEKLDLIIQVGDLGAFPEPDEEMKNTRFVLEDPTELDFSRYINAKGKTAESILYTREKHINRIYFIRGNHDDFNWLNSTSHVSENGIVDVDPFGILHYVTDGTIQSHGELSIAFLGGIETEQTEPKSIDTNAYKKLMQMDPGVIDILITHDAPYGISTSFTGKTQGSPLVSELIKKMQPRYLIAGHYHHMNGPTNYGKTTYLGLNILIPPLRRDELRKVQPGSLAILDTAKDTLQFVTAEWLSGFAKGFRFNSFVKQVKETTSILKQG